LPDVPDPAKLEAGTEIMTITEQYRHAVAEKSRAEEYRRTAVQYMDTHWAINRLRHWTEEVQRLIPLVDKEIARKEAAFELEGIL